MTDEILELLLQSLQRKLSLTDPDSDEEMLMADELENAERELLLYLGTEQLEERFYGKAVELAALYYRQDTLSEQGCASRSYTEGQVTQSDSYFTPAQLKEAAAELFDSLARYRRVSC